MAAAEVRLYNNGLTRFEELVFKKMLSEMHANPWRGRIFLGNSKKFFQIKTINFFYLSFWIHLTDPFDCSTPCGVCHLQWLVQANPQYLPYLDNARCSSDVTLNGAYAGKLFSELPSSVFTGCNANCPQPSPPAHLKPVPGQHVVCNGAESLGMKFPDPSSVSAYYECDDLGDYFTAVNNFL